MKRYLVGGAVRDILLGRPVVDQDYLIVDATPEAFLKRYRRARQVGKTFPVFMLGQAQYAWPRGEDLNEDLLAGGATLEQVAEETGAEFGQIDWTARQDAGARAYSTKRLGNSLPPPTPTSPPSGLIPLLAASFGPRLFCRRSLGCGSILPATPSPGWRSFWIAPSWQTYPK